MNPDGFWYSIWHHPVFRVIFGLCLIVMGVCSLVIVILGAT